LAVIGVKTAQHKALCNSLAFDTRNRQTGRALEEISSILAGGGIEQLAVES
jgi:hypothetical protein